MPALLLLNRKGNPMKHPPIHAAVCSCSPCREYRRSGPARRAELLRKAAPHLRSAAIGAAAGIAPFLFLIAIVRFPALATLLGL